MRSRMASASLATLSRSASELRSCSGSWTVRLRSISAHIGNDYRRVRLGIGHPGLKELVHSYVLNDFAKDERPWVTALCEAIADNAGMLADGRDSTFQNKVHLAMQAKGFFDQDDDGAA